MLPANRASLSAVLLVFVLLCSRSLTSNSQCYPVSNRRSGHSRQFDSLLGQLPQVFKFRPIDEKESVRLQFTVPFFKVPVKKTSDTARAMFKDIRDANQGLLFTGVTTVAGIGAVLALALEPGIVNKAINFIGGMNPFNGHKGGKSKSDFSAASLLLYMLENRDNIDMMSCIQNVVCAIVKHSAENVAQGRGSSVDKIVDGMTSTEWVLEILAGTQLGEIIENGRTTGNCSASHQLCSGFDDYVSHLIY